MKSHNRVAFVGLVAATALILAGCSSPPSPGANTATSEKPIKVGLVLRTLSGTPTWVSVKDGAQAEAKKLGNVDLTIAAAASEADVTGQINKVQDVLSSGVDVLAIAANGTTELGPILTQAVDKKIPVILIDQIVSGFTQYSSYIAGDDAGAGKEMAEYIVKGLGAKAKGAQIGILDYPGNPTLATRINAAKKVFAADGLNVVSELPSNCDVATSQNSVENMLTAHPDLAAVFGGCGNGAAGAVQAAKAAHKSLVITGIDGNNLEFRAIKAGDEYATELQDFKGWGETAVKLAVDLAHGKKVPKTILSKDTVITKENVNDNQPSG